MPSLIVRGISTEAATTKVVVPVKFPEFELNAGINIGVDIYSVDGLFMSIDGGSDLPVNSPTVRAAALAVNRKTFGTTGSGLLFAPLNQLYSAGLGLVGQPFIRVWDKVVVSTDEVYMLFNASNASIYNPISVQMNINYGVINLSYSEWYRSKVGSTWTA